MGVGKTTHTPPRKRYDVIVVGSGAAGGMAGFQLATAGLRVLVLEAGQEVDTRKTFKTMEWPYQTPRRGRLEPTEHALNVAEYNMTDRPYGTAKEFAKYPRLYSYGGNRYTTHAVVNEKEHPLPRREQQVVVDPEVKDAWGVPVLRFRYTFGDNERAMAADMADTAEEMLRASGAEDISVRRDMLTEGWSIHELGTARMGTDPRTSVANSFGQTHDVKNLFLSDGSTFVSAGCQNPTWTIMALCWRGMDYLKEELRRGNL